ncbi:MAG TPA: hypothetical protein VGJ26_04605, partial [Pirellulales bacterium]
MFASRLAGVLVLTLIQAFAALALAGEADKLTFTGQVLLADGSPVAHAVVERQGTNQHETFPTQADGEGRFQVSDRFENGVHLHVRSADNREQIVYQMPAPSVRVQSRTPHHIKLSPASLHKVSVLVAGQPVADAEVALTGTGFTATAKTDSAGQAEVAIPQGASLRGVAALHSSRGVGGQFFREGSVPQESYVIELQPTAPHEIRVVDDDDQPVAGLEFGVHAATGNFEFILLSPLSNTRVRTNESGIAKAAWIPRDKLRVVNPQIRSDDWKEDALDYKRMADGITVQKLRRKHPLSGRLNVPAGVDPTGILIGGMGFGSGSRIDRVSARARADGTFKLMVVLDHSYILGVQDTEWACEPWTGDVRTEADSEQAQVELALYRATPVTVRVSRGPDHQPVANTFVQVGTERQFKYTNEKGQRGTALGSLWCWLMTDADGVGRAAVGHGEHKFNLSAGDWNEERKVNIKSNDSVEVDFHRAWVGKRKIVG